MKNCCRQFLAIALSVSLIWTSGHFADAAPISPVGPASSELTPPSSLGYVTDSFKAPSSTKQVILIQDLHAHYGVQKNIAGILDFLTTKLSSPAANQSSSPAVTGRGSMDPRRGHSG